jgi:hypothetical protein
MKKLNSFLFAAACAIILSTSAQGQMVGNNVFLQGNHVEVGIGPRGNYGSDTTAPAGYHNSNVYYACFGGGTARPLGLLADPAADGWATGTPPLFGDFFLPGTPFEGWAIQSDTSRASAYGTSCTLATGLTGANTSYTVSGGGSVVSSTWDGMFDSLTIHKVTSLDTGALYFTTKVTITNISATAKNNIYYLRTLDPDNDQSQGGSFVTRNKIEYQLPNSLNATVVSATGTVYAAAYYAMGSVDTHAKCLIYSGWPISSHTGLDSVYNQSSTLLGASVYYGAHDTAISDIAIGIMFKVGHLAALDSAADSVGRTTSLHPANSLTFTYFSSFSGPATDSAIAHLTVHAPAIDSSYLEVGGISQTNSGEVKVYPNPHKNIINITGLAANDELLYYDMAGRLAAPPMLITTEGTSTLPTPNMPAGYYLLVIKDKSGVAKAKIPVQRQ